MQILAIQLDIAWEDREANHREVAAMVDAAQPPTGSLIVLPEMFASGFSMNVAKIAEDESRPTERFLCDLARAHRAHIVAGLVSRVASGRGRNEAIVIDPVGAVIARYCKLHPFCMGMDRTEKECFEPGQQVVTFRWKDFIVSPFICYDLRFPEVFRHAARLGANLFCVIASWPAPRIAHWITLLQARAIENQAYVVGVNRVGNDPSHDYPGRSLVVDPMGRIVANAGDGECVLPVELSIGLVDQTRQSLPFLRDIRPDFVK